MRYGPYDPGFPSTWATLAHDYEFRWKFSCFVSGTRGRMEGFFREGGGIARNGYRFEIFRVLNILGILAIYKMDE